MIAVRIAAVTAAACFASMPASSRVWAAVSVSKVVIAVAAYRSRLQPDLPRLRILTLEDVNELPEGLPGNGGAPGVSLGGRASSSSTSGGRDFATLDGMTVTANRAEFLRWLGKAREYADVLTDEQRGAIVYRIEANVRRAARRVGDDLPTPPRGSIMKP